MRCAVRRYSSARLGSPAGAGADGAAADGVAAADAPATEGAVSSPSVGLPADSWSDTRVMVTQSICKSPLVERREQKKLKLDLRRLTLPYGRALRGRTAS